MDQLPNLGKIYQLITFNEVLGTVFVYFIENKQTVLVDIPVVDDMYIEGVDLDNYIMSWAPIIPKTKDLRQIVKNADTIKALVTPFNKVPATEDYLRRKAIERRSAALQSCDWTQLPDVQEVMPIEEKRRWKKFRQELRDITHQPNYPVNIAWPQRPYMMGIVIYD